MHEAALRHLSRFAATEAGLRRVLERRVQRWVRACPPEDAPEPDAVKGLRMLARDVAQALVAAGAVNDTAFAQARAARLARAGRSRRSVSAHLLGKGVAAELVQQSVGEGDELPVALAYAKRRRIGPFRAEPDKAARLSDMAALARAGFQRDVAERVVAFDKQDAEDCVQRLKRGEHDA